MSLSSKVPVQASLPIPSRNGRSQSVNADSPHDSGVEGLSGTNSPLKRKPRPEGDHDDDQKSSSDAEDFEATGSLSKNDIPDNPFRTEHSRILFEAIDDLQAYGSSRLLSIPQLIIIGGQSAGKSSLLQTLTGIPFPVEDGCCTRFPTRIISSRTPVGSRDSYRVTIEEAGFEIDGLEPALPNFMDYKREGGTLTSDEFVKIVEEVSSDCMGIRNGPEADKKNFASEVLRIELSGPNRSYFSILDLPGYISNPVRIKTSDPPKVEKMVVEYMKRPENIVVVVTDITIDFTYQNIFKLANRYVNKERILGVFTKCDRPDLNPHRAREAVDIAKTVRTNEAMTLGKGWFFVQNRTSEDPDSFDLDAAEAKLFGAYPWNQVEKDRLGSKNLKTYLGALLNSKIRDCFPTLRDNITAQLDARRTQAAELGALRDNYPAQQQYVNNIVHKFKEIADKCLDNPGYLDQTLEIKRKEKMLKEQFALFMRINGATWDFQEEEKGTQEFISLQRKSFVFDSAYDSFSPVADANALQKRIENELSSFQVLQLPGIINPNVYHRMYQLQVAKWTKIAETFLQQVRDSVKDCITAILDSVCPLKDSTKRLRRGLEKRMENYFDSAYYKAEDDCRRDCKREADCTRLQTSDPRFADELAFRRQIRFTQAASSVEESEEVLTQEKAFAKLFSLMHWSLNQNMVHDVHDVLKVYYQLSLETFIRNISIIAGEFVSGENGPLRMMNPTNILMLSEEEIKLLGSEEDSTQKYRDDLIRDILKLENALETVDTASRRTSDL